MNATETIPAPASAPAAPSDAVVVLTDAAARHITGMIADDKEATGKALRVYIEAGGCSGMQYGMTFDEKRDDDFVTTYGGVQVVVDPFSAPYLRGAQIDYKDELSGGGFKISNPNAHSSCGCGKSFSA